jgi:Ser/Thr protein kinase RdoA (MazF antagonist)
VTQLAREYDLGGVISFEPLAGGGADVRRITTERGSFVQKRAGRPQDVELQAEVAEFLSARGIRQARIRPTWAGALISADGSYLQEYLPGTITTRPSARQAAAAMRYIGAYHHALAALASSYEPDPASLWTRVADPGFLLRTLPGLLARYDIPSGPAQSGLTALAAARDRLEALPRQIVHGDIGPDNVLMDGNQVVSIIDFTPYHESAVFGACTALYWYHAHESSGAGAGSRPDLASRLQQSVRALGAHRPWSPAELALWPAGLLREALRRLATPLALAAETHRPPGPSVPARYAALLAVLRVLPRLP